MSSNLMLTVFASLAQRARHPSASRSTATSETAWTSATRPSTCCSQPTAGKSSMCILVSFSLMSRAWRGFQLIARVCAQARDLGEGPFLQAQLLSHHDCSLRQTPTGSETQCANVSFTGTLWRRTSRRARPSCWTATPSLASPSQQQRYAPQSTLRTALGPMMTQL